MKLGILSDTHDQVARTARAMELLRGEGAEAVVHCGDLTGPEVVFECAMLPAYYVFGNNDFDEGKIRVAVEETGGVLLGRGGFVQLDGRRVAVTHGDVTAEVRRLLAAGPDYLLYGHSHLAADARDGPTRRINPGALHRAREWTVALLDLRADALRFLAVR